MAGKVETAKQRMVMPVGAGKGLFGYDYHRHVKADKMEGVEEQLQYRSINEYEASIVHRMYGMASAI